MSLFIRFILGLLVVFGSVPVWAETEKPEVELTHWWVSSAEQAALDEIAQAFIRKGGRFKPVPIAGNQKLREKVLKQISLGYPPAVTQWLGGKNLVDLNQVHSIRYLPEKWRDQPLKELLFPEVLEEVSVVSGDKIAGIPVVTHIQNTAFFNGEIYRDLSLPLPKDWAMFMEQAEVIRKAGYTPLALSAQSWQLRMLFNTILIEQAGVDGFAEFYDPEKELSQWRSMLLESLSLFEQLRAFVDQHEQEIDWTEAAKKLAAGEAAMLVIGDFVTGELTQMGKQAGVDFLCKLAPGTDHLMVYAIDSFVMLNVEEAYLKAGQDLLFDVVLDGEVQAAFNGKKGGIPVRKGVDMGHLDVCTRERYQRWLDEGTVKRRPPDTINSLCQSFVETMLHNVWLGKEGAEEAVDNMIRVANAAVK